jgi:hypothetical protein
VIYDSATNGTVYDNTTSTLRLAHTIPAGTLANGKDYACDVTAYDMSGVAATSAKAVFSCLTTPEWRIVGIATDQTLRNASVTVTLQYSQQQGEALNEYRVVVSTADQSLFWDSGLVYSAPCIC